MQKTNFNDRSIKKYYYYIAYLIIYNWQKSNHDCIQYLLESIVKLGKENEDLTYFNKERLVEKEKNEKNHQTFLYESQVQKQILEEDNENKQRENYLLREEIDKIKRNREKKISLIMKEFYEFADKKNEKLQEKNEKERKNLFRRINNCTNDYLDKAKKGLFDLNCFVQADAGDLSKVPTDMKEYDKSPLRKFTTVGPAKINI